MDDLADRLFEAVKDGTSSVKSIIMQQPIDVLEVRNEFGQTLLHAAAGYGKTNLVSFLLSEGADPNAQDFKGQSPLHAACNHCHLRVSIKLIEAGADVNLADLRGWSPLHFAVTRKYKTENLQLKYWDVIKLLLENGADPYLSSKISGRSCIARICDNEARRAVRLTHLLIKLKNIDDTDCKSRVATIKKYMTTDDFFELVKIGDEKIDVIKLVTIPDLLESRLAECDNITPLHRAAGWNHLELARWFIEEGARVDATDNSDRIPLHNAAQYGHIEMIDLLTDNGSDINKKDHLGYTPLHVAATNRTYTACLRLIELGADIDAKCNEGRIPFELAEADDVKEVLKPKSLRHRVELIPSSSEQAIYIQMHTIAEETPHDQCSLQDDELMLDSSSDEPLFKNPKHQIKKVLLQENDRLFQLVKKRMLETIVRHGSDCGGTYSTYEIISIERILNAKVWIKYRLMCQRLELEFGQGRRNERLLFHGSKTVDEIQFFGFDERYAQSKGMFGAGLYFAEHSSKSNQYTFGLGQGCKEHSDKSCYVCERKMIYAQVALGKSHTSKEAMPDCAHGPPKFSSVTGSPESTENLLYPEYVIYNGDQAYPLFVITYKIKL